MLGLVLVPCNNLRVDDLILYCHKEKMSLLSSIICNPAGSKPHQPLVILQTSSAQTCFPILRTLISNFRTQTLLFCFLHPPSSLTNVDVPHITALDFTGQIPGYNDAWCDPQEEILAHVSSGECISRV